VLAIVDRGMPRAKVAKPFGVSVSAIKRYLTLRRQTGGVRPKLILGPPARKRMMLEEQPTVTSIASPSASTSVPQVCPSSLSPRTRGSVKVFVKSA
jgi:hypothetical protein